MWERYNLGGQQAANQGNWAEAERSFKMALQEAEGLGLKDPRLPLTLVNLANCFRQTGRFPDAEPLYKRALEVKTKQVGPLHNDLVPILENYSKMLRASGREKEADKMQRDAMAIFARK
jgi:tetratricopeptide (TPR) repeat protein